MHRRVAHAIDLLIDHRVLLDERVGGRQVRLGLVVVVVRDEVLDGVLGEQLFKLVVKLRREGLVVGDDQRRALGLFDDAGGGKGLARAGQAQEHLARLATIYRVGELRDGDRLIASRLVVRDQLERLRGRHGPQTLAQTPTPARVPQ